VIAVAAGADANAVKTDFPPLRILVGAAESVTVRLEGVGVGAAVGVGVGVGVPDMVKAL